MTPVNEKGRRRQKVIDGAHRGVVTVLPGGLALGCLQAVSLQPSYVASNLQGAVEVFLWCFIE